MKRIVGILAVIGLLAGCAAIPGMPPTPCAGGPACPATPPALCASGAACPSGVPSPPCPTGTNCPPAPPPPCTAGASCPPTVVLPTACASGPACPPAPGQAPAPPCAGGTACPAPPAPLCPPGESCPSAGRPAGLAGAPPAIPALHLSSVSLPRYEKLELTLDLIAEYQNPFDPAQIDVQASFSGPGGQQISVPGFFWQNFSSALADGKEALTPQGRPTWKVRFTPPREGSWSVTARVKTPAGQAQSQPASFSVTPARRHGFVRVDQRDPAYFAFDDGAPYVAIGQNVGWYGDGGTRDYERWFGRMHAQGANFARVWMASWAFGIEWSDTGLGDYTKRLDRAWQLDRVFDLAAESDIYIMLTLLNHGAFNTGVNPEWQGNPYSAANGGPCARPEDFATSPQARELFKRRLRYIAARWGYSPNLLAWEWWNEVDWTPLSASATQQAWIKEMTGALAQFDPYGHLRTTSYASSGDEAVFGMPEIDITQRHSYNPADPADTFARGTAEMLALGQPALFGEFGTGADGADATIDRQGVHVHNGLWAGLMSKGAGTGMSWWWDNYIDPNDLYPLFKGPAAFFAGEDPAAAGYKPRRPRIEGAPAAMLLLAAPDRMLGWVRSNAATYDALRGAYARELSKAMAEKRKLTSFEPSFPPVEGATWQLSGLNPGAYTVEWWDTAAGTPIGTTPLAVAAGGATLKFPVFTRDLAFKIKPA